MDRIRIRGGRRLEGRVPIGGAKNAALPLMAASLLTDETLTLGNLPDIADIATLASLLRQLGVSPAPDGRADRRLALAARDIVNTTAPYEQVRKMRASVLVLGPLLARCG
ncbi:MAG: UDP-N-acetylglucosamine 1-carboxyvinyltransferase, partial [Alphaproteobacteria bacterium]